MMTKSYFGLFKILLCCCVFYSFNAFCQEFTTPEISIEFINSTDTKANVDIKEQVSQKPYKYVEITNFSLNPGQIDSMPIVLLDNLNQKRTISVFTSGETGYGQAGSSIDLDISKSTVFTVELYEAWVYPGDELWPPVEPFRVIQARLVKYS